MILRSERSNPERFDGAEVPLVGCAAASCLGAGLDATSSEGVGVLERWASDSLMIGGPL